MRVHGMDSNLINEISKKLPEESKIADKLEEDKEISIIRWTLLNRPKNIENYCTMDEDGNLRGELAQYFEQAIRIEGVYKNQGIHAAGLVISKHNLEEVCPMIYHAETKQKIVGVEMDSAKKLGCIKFDILGNLCLDRLQLVGQLLRGGI
jgi:DNA polymerase III alpha subunit